VKIFPVSFENHNIRRVYDEKTQSWFFSVVDVIQVLTQQTDYQAARNYWKVLKNRLGKEGSQSVTKCNRLKLPAADGKSYLTDVAEVETLLRLVQSVPSPKAEPIIHQEWSGLTVGDHKAIKQLKSQNLRDHMTEAELIFTALAELSTRQIAETHNATGMDENKVAAKTGGNIAKKARLELEQKTGQSVVTGQNYLSPPKTKRIEGT